MQGKYLLETSLVDGYLLEDGTGNLFLEATSINTNDEGTNLELYIKGEDFTNKTLKVATVKAFPGTGTGQQTITIPGLGAPRAAMISINRCTSGSSQIVGAQFNVGFTDGTNVYAIATNCQDAVATSNTHRFGTDALLCWIQNVDGTEDARASFVEFVQDGITIDWITTPASNYILLVTLFAGGSEELFAKVGSFTTPDSSGSSVVVSDVGFEPDQIIGISQGRAFDFTVNANAIFSYGVCDNSDGVITQGSINYFNEDNLADTNIKCVISRNYFAWNNGGDDGAVELSDFNISGFTATTRVSATGMPMAYLALNYNGNVKHKVDFMSTLAVASGGLQTISGVGFGPQFVHQIQSTLTAYDTPISDVTAGVVGISFFGSGMITPTSFQENHNIRSQDNAATSNEDSRYGQNTAFLRRSDEFGVQGVTTTLNSLFYDGFKNDYSLNTVGRQWIYFAIGNPISSATIDLFIHGHETFNNDCDLFVHGYEPLIARNDKIYFTNESQDVVKRCNLDGSNVEVIVSGGLTTPRGIDIDYASETLFWIDSASASKIYRSDLDGSNSGVVLSVLGASGGVGLTIARESGTMFWTDTTNGIIERANLDGTGRTVVVSGGTPRHIDYDPVESNIYWTDRNGGLVRRANYDGSNIQTIASGFTVIQGIAVDHENRRVWWGAGAIGGTIRSSDLSGNNVVIHFSDLNDISTPITTTIDFIENKFYWNGGLGSSQGIHRSNLNGTNLFVLPNTSGIGFSSDAHIDQHDFGIDLFISGAPPSVNENCDLFITGHEYFIANVTKLYFYDELGDASISRCDPDGSNREFIVGSPEIQSLATSLYADASHDYLYWIEPGISADVALRRIDIDGSNFVTLAASPDLDNILNFDVSVITNTIYYTPSSGGIIQTSDLLGNNITTIYNDPTDKPEEIVYDRQEDKIYWTEVNNDDAIYRLRRADSDGSNIENISATSDTWRIYSLDLDRQRRKLYWANEASLVGEVNISRSNLDGSASGIVIPSGYRNIYEVDVDSINKKVYWNSIRDGNVYRADLDGQNIELVLNLTAFPFDIPLSIYQRIYLPLSITGLGHESNDCDLFIWGHQSITNDLDLFINGHIEFNNDIDLFISGFINVNLVTNDIDLFIHGHQSITNDIDLFVWGHETFSNTIDLFINGRDSNTNDLDLFIHGHASFSNNINLFINGHDSNSQNLDLVIIGHETITTDIDLFIHGQDSESNSLDLFIHGHDTQSNDLDLFINGVASFSNDCDLFINGRDSESNDIDLYENGHATHTNDIDLFINGSQSFNNDIDLFVSGIGYITNDITLFISSINIVASGIDLFIHGRDTFTDNIDLFIEASVSFSNSINLFIYGKDSNSNDCDLFIHGKDTHSNDIDLFTSAAQTISNDLDLFVKGKDSESNDIDLFVSGVSPGATTITSDVDLFIHGKDSESNSIDLFVSGVVLIANDINLFILGPILITDSINLFVKQNDLAASGIDLFINGLQTPNNQACPALDPTLPIQIGDDLIEIYQSRIDSLINQLGKNVLLEFNPITQPCTNCEFDVISGKSKGIYKIGGPIPFPRGQKCPYCKGIGFLEQPVYKCIKCLIQWNPKDAKTYGISVSDPLSIVRFKGFLTDGDDMARAKSAIANYDIDDLMKFRVKLIKEPIIVGLRESRYIIAFWRLIDS